jgi:hypothetical protein
MALFTIIPERTARTLRAHGDSQFPPIDVADAGTEDERRLTRDEAERTVQAGVTGVPLYVINERELVSGAQRVSVFREAIERALATVA